MFTLQAELSVFPQVWQKKIWCEDNFISPATKISVFLLITEELLHKWSMRYFSTQKNITGLPNFILRKDLFIFFHSLAFLKFYPETQRESKPKNQKAYSWEPKGLWDGWQRHTFLQHLPGTPVHRQWRCLLCIGHSLPWTVSHTEKMMQSKK